jgi:hypothetical protein
LNRHSRNRRTLIRALLSELRRLFGRFGKPGRDANTHGTLDPMVALVRQYGQAAATLGADFYEELRSEAGVSGGFTVPILEPAEPEQVRRSLGWATKDVGTEGEDRAATETKVEGAAQRLALQPERQTITDASEADPQAIGWARVSTDPNGPCGWCATLISRGPAYHTRASASQASGKRGKRPAGAPYHSNDMCVPVPVFGDDWPGSEQYDRYDQLWGEITSRGLSGKDAINAMRRHLEGRD